MPWLWTVLVAVNAATVLSAPIAITVFSADLHHGLVEDLKWIWSRMPEINVTWIDKSLSVYCHFADPPTCASEIFKSTVLSFDDIIQNRPAGRDRFAQYFETLMKQTPVDIVVCTHPMSGCQIYVPFADRVSIIAYQAVPLTAFLPTAREKNVFFQEYMAWSKDSRHLLLVNNKYHQEQTFYETGYRPTYLRNVCAYTRHKSQPVSFEPHLRTILIGRKPSEASASARALQGALERYKASAPCNYNIQFMDYHGHSGFSFLENISAIVYYPYTVSLMSFFEYYYTDVPIFAPALPLAIQLDTNGTGMHMRLHDVALMDGHHTDLSNPGNMSSASLTHWLSLADPYALPHVQHFQSDEHLVQLLCTMQLTPISRRMRTENDRELQRIRTFWTRFMLTTFNQENAFMIG